MHISWTRAAVLLVLLCAGSGARAADAPVREVVLQPGQSIEATNKFGHVKVAYVSPIKRKYEWDGQSRVVTMMPRPERFQGELGIYDGAGCFAILIPLCRTPRLVVREAYHDYDSYDQIYASLYVGSAVMDWVYTTDGLVVGFSRSPGREQINVDVRQITLHGKKPSSLRGARDDAIHLLTQ